jgi:ATP-dependent Clp protease ATP-binding subunit ClpA
MPAFSQSLEKALHQALTIANERHHEFATPTAGFQRVIQRAVIHVQSSGREEVTGANVLVAIFAERESHAAYFLQEQDMTRYDAVNYISTASPSEPGASERARCAAPRDEQTPSRRLAKKRATARTRSSRCARPTASTSTRRRGRRSIR